jgi:hypothetical protein
MIVLGVAVCPIQGGIGSEVISDQPCFHPRMYPLIYVFLVIITRLLHNVSLAN